MTIEEAIAVLALDAKCPGLVKWDVVMDARLTLLPITKAAA